MAKTNTKTTQTKIEKRRAEMVRSIEELAATFAPVRRRFVEAPDVAEVVLDTMTAYDDSYARLLSVARDPQTTDRAVLMDALANFTAAANALQALTE